MRPLHNDGFLSRASLHLLTGAWGSGKSSIIPHLVGLLPECVVFDWDLIIPALSLTAGKDVYTDTSTWDGLCQTWVAIVEALLVAGHDVLLCGPANPDEFTRGGHVVAADVRCAYLDCPDRTLIERLRVRGASEAAIRQELATSSRLRSSNWDSIPAEGADPGDVARRVALWVRTSE